MDVDYILGCAVELGEITALEESVLRRHPRTNAQLDRLIQARRDIPDHYLQNTARHTLNKVPQQERYFYALCSLDAMPWALDAMTQRAEHLVQSRIQELLGVGKPAPLQLYPELRAPRPAPAITCEADIGEGAIRGLLDEMFTPMGARMFEDVDLVREAVEWYRFDEGAQFAQMLAGTSAPKPKGMPAAELLKQVAVQRARQKAKENRTLVATAKAAIKKATKLFQNLGQESNLRLFVSGGEVTLSHPDSRFKLVVKPLEVSGWLIDRTQTGRAHTPYELSLFTKDDVFLAKLCVYFQDTPVLDQLLALTFYVQAGDEVQILEKANWFSTSDWTEAKTALVLEAYPHLESKVPRIRKPGDNPERGHIALSREFEEAEAHWRPFKGRVEQWVSTWFEPIRLPAIAVHAEMVQVRELLAQDRELAEDSLIQIGA
jgi:hypothetical protein